MSGDELQEVTNVSTALGSRQELFIGGEWVPPETGTYRTSTSPATQAPIAEVPQGTAADVDKAVRAARAAFRANRSATQFDRAAMCRRIADTWRANRDELARVLSTEQGKPLYTEAYPEVDKAIEGWTQAAEHIKHLEGTSIRLQDPNKRAFTMWQPRGVYAIVTPWNFPVNIPVEYLGPGLAAGNAIVWKPATTSSLIAGLMTRLIDEAGTPKGLVNLVTGSGRVVGDAAVAHPDVNGVGLTGSSETGLNVARIAAGKPLILELGGNGPTIVLEDANIEAAADAIARGTYRNAGQICMATELVLCHRDVIGELSRGIVEFARTLKVGDPLASDTTMGPLNNPAVADKTDRHIQDAVNRGAAVLFGGTRLPELGSPLFYAPTVLTDVPVDAALVKEETFGPVCPLVAVASEEEALALTETIPYGLVASVWSRNMGRAQRVAESLRAGLVNINETSAYWELHVPCGGGSGTVSGLGRLGGRYTLEEMSDIKTITYDLTRF